MIVTLCGSSRFENLFKEWNLALTLAGHAVFTLTLFPSDRGRKDWYDDEEKAAMDAAYRTKISASDRVLVLNCGGYIGDSTLGEVRFAQSIGKPVHFLESWGEGCGRDGVRSPLSTVGPSGWDLLGPAGPVRSRSVLRLEAAKDSDLRSLVSSLQSPVSSSPSASGPPPTAHRPPPEESR